VKKSLNEFAFTWISFSFWTKARPPPSG
jgi:hypothetical protein